MLVTRTLENLLSQVEDTEFSNNDQVVSGYMGHYAKFARCTFINNKNCFTAADYVSVCWFYFH